MTLSGVGVVGPLKFSKIPLSDHGVHLKGLVMIKNINLSGINIKMNMFDANFVANW